MSDYFRINPKSANMPLSLIKSRIEKGLKLQELEEKELSEDEQLELSDAIIIAPDYQREYRSTVSDESSLVESLLLGIPIPPIFLVSQKLKGVPVLNVVDGQHRLRALYRFLNNDFKLRDLKIIDDYKNASFRDLKLEDKQFLQNSEITTTTFRDFPGENFELEIFSRYNKGTKPLTPQDIRHAVYSSKVNDMVNSFCKNILTDTDEHSLGSVYGASQERYKKKKIQESIFVILSILEFGIIQEAKKSPEFAENYMKLKHEKEKSETDEAVTFENLEKAEVLFKLFNNLILSLTKFANNPFSKEIYGISSRGGKFQVSISMILASVFHELVKKINVDAFIENNIEMFYEVLSYSIMNSYLEDPEYRASTTNTDEINKLTRTILESLSAHNIL